jgi:hypothetical protein
MTNPYGGTKKGWYRSADVPFSWREWVWISNSSKGIYKSKDKKRDLPFQKKGDFVNKNIGTRMNFFLRAFDAKDKDQLAYVSCYVMRKPKSHQKEKTLAKKQVEWRYIQPKPSKVSEIKKLLDQPMKQSSEWDD